MFEWILLANILASLLMTGIIWFVQIVQYPGFLHIAPSNFQRFHRFHVSRTGLVVIPPMIVELGSSLWLTIGFNQYWFLNVLGLFLVIGIWLSTFAIQVPIHSALQDGATENVSKLVATNWIRTILWTLKAGLGGYLLFLWG